MNPPLAVIMPVRNGMPFLVEALDSIRAQNYSPLELVIIDDGSTDGTLEFIRRVEDSRVTLLQSDAVGPASARNAGLHATTSDLVAFLDADDLWPAGTLHALTGALTEHPEAGFAQGLIRNFGGRDAGDRQFVTSPYRFLNLGANLWRRSVFEIVGPLDDSLRLCEDLDFLMRCWEKDIRKVELNRVVLHYRRHPASLTHGLSGASVGTLKAFKKRIDRVRSGEYDARAVCERPVGLQAYLGTAPASQDGNLFHDSVR